MPVLKRLALAVGIGAFCMFWLLFAIGAALGGFMNPFGPLTDWTTTQSTLGLPPLGIFITRAVLLGAVIGLLGGIYYEVWRWSVKVVYEGGLQPIFVRYNYGRTPEPETPCDPDDLIMRNHVSLLFEIPDGRRLSLYTEAYIGVAIKRLGTLQVVVKRALFTRPWIDTINGEYTADGYVRYPEYAD